MGDDVKRVFKHSKAHFQTAILLHLQEERMHSANPRNIEAIHQEIVHALA
jgi:predicted RNA-binding protein (virulence factor B family)